MTTRPLLIHQVPARTLLDAIYYRDECLKALITKKEQSQSQMAFSSTMSTYERCYS